MTRRWRRLASIACTLVLGVLTLPVQAGVRYIHTDALGSVVAVTDEQGNVIERREYEPYGAQLTPALQDGPGYTGHVQDAATGLVYMQQRYYDPGIGRFLSVDPVTANSGTGANFNRYWYANNNPYKFKDPDGRQSESVMDRRYVYSRLNSDQVAGVEAQHNKIGGQVAKGMAAGAAVATMGAVAVKSGAVAALGTAAVRVGAAAESASMSTGFAAQGAVNGMTNGVSAASTATTSVAVRTMAAVESEVSMVLGSAGVSPGTSSAVASQVASPGFAAEVATGAITGAANVPSPATSLTNYASGEVANSVRERIDK